MLFILTAGGCLATVKRSLVPFLVQSFYEKRLNKLQQKQTQLILYPQHVLSEGKKAPKNPIRGKFRKTPKHIPFIRI